MHLELNNIGKLSDASIDINGIAVIAGENNTGRSNAKVSATSSPKSCSNLCKSA